MKKWSIRIVVVLILLMFLLGVVIVGRVAYAATSSSDLAAILNTAVQGLGKFFDFLIEVLQEL